VAKLQDKGITIARRTVAKYREELGILPSKPAARLQVAVSCRVAACGGPVRRKRRPYSPEAPTRAFAASQRSRHERSSSWRTGFAMKSSIPARDARVAIARPSRWPSARRWAAACLQAAGGSAASASSPSMPGIWQSISTASQRSIVATSTADSPSPTITHCRPSFFRAAVSITRWFTRSSSTTRHAPGEQAGRRGKGRARGSRLRRAQRQRQFEAELRAAPRLAVDDDVARPCGSRGAGKSPARGPCRQSGGSSSLSPCEKTWKSLPCVASSMPMPVSVTPKPERDDGPGRGRTRCTAISHLAALGET